jgi:lipopolysaccharide/colanic/teichoic acid biosynthesis glycosyltransferase
MVIKDGMNLFERAIKRLFDFLASSIGLIALSPIFLYIIYRLYRQKDGSPIYRQERIGYGGKPFHILKFRTMRVDSEKCGEAVLAAKDDERLTSFGKTLRESHLDELPQLINIIKGEMSFVGPRPERQHFIDLITKENPNYKYIYLMKPGLTSKATIYNGYTDTMEKMLTRLEMDLEDLQTRSLWGDFKLIILTITNILKGNKI